MRAVSINATRPTRVSIDGLQRGLLWLFVASGAVGSIEPSPYEAMFVPVAIAFGFGALRFDRSMAPLIIGLAGLNAGGALALLPYIDDRDSVMFSAISLYVAITSIFFAGLIAKDPLERLRTIRSAYIAGAVVASLAAILGYFDVAGLADRFTLYNRAAGTFKDPNVLAPFLTLPLVWLAQSVILRQSRGFWRTYLPMLLILIALFLSFSRGGWGVWAAATTLMIALTFVTARSPALRQRIILLTVLGVGLLAVLFVVALSIPAVRDVFEVRASLSQEYDIGQTGRFGDQLRSIPMLLERPFGFGPLQYRNHFEGVDPHNVFINAFASYGWIGGLSYAVLIAVTVVYGWRVVFKRSPLQNELIAIWSCLFFQILQGFQIDSDHWRHFFLMLGAFYGLLAATRVGLARAARQRFGAASSLSPGQAESIAGERPPIARFRDSLDGVVDLAQARQ
ncbi:MAG TPA: O-antigen ligase family protein [Roseiarcus sp.]|nr:O-antigen ligase family protein [Roseiarcus sp.]